LFKGGNPVHPILDSEQGPQRHNFLNQPENRPHGRDKSDSPPPQPLAPREPVGCYNSIAKETPPWSLVAPLLTQEFPGQLMSSNLREAPYSQLDNYREYHAEFMWPTALSRFS
jgi:hypothetical protein